MWLVAARVESRRVSAHTAFRCFASRTPSRKGNAITLTGRKSLKVELTEYMHGRGNRERRDSVTNEILRERELHLLRLGGLYADPIIVRAMKMEGLGHKRRKHQVYASKRPTFDDQMGSGKPGVRKTNSGAGMFC